MELVLVTCGMSAVVLLLVAGALGAAIKRGPFRILIEDPAAADAPLLPMRSYGAGHGPGASRTSRIT